MSFDSLGLSAELLRALETQGYTEPTPIQAKAIPVVLQGGDVLAAAQTGTGKTAGFTLPLLQRLIEAGEGDNRPNQPRALILVPTRELAAQVAESVSTYGAHLPLKAAVMFGGVKINPQIAQLKKGVDILIATPGRLLDHVQQRTLDLSRIEILVLDEADRMLDMGFIHDIRKVLALLPEKRQTLLFSATFSNAIRTLADKLLNQPVSIDVAPHNTPTELVEQVVHPVDKGRKRELLSHLIGSNNWRQVLVFTRTKHGANRLAKQLESDGLSAAAIHGNKTQGARTRALAGFKDGTVRVLVATDIAARGLDIDQLPHVVNFELPNVSEDYVHRIGRTGRAGNEGEAMSLVCVDELKLLRDIERLLGRKIRSETLAGYEPDPSIKAEPIQNGRDKGARNNSNRGQRRPARTEASNSTRNKPARAKAEPGNSARSKPARARAEEGNRARSKPARARPEDGNSVRNRPARGKPAQGQSRGPRNTANSRSENPGNEINGNLAPPPREVDGNRISAPREADGNRVPDDIGNRPRRPSSSQKKGQSRQRSGNQRRDKPALLGG